MSNVRLTGAWQQIATHGCVVQASKEADLWFGAAYPAANVTPFKLAANRATLTPDTVVWAKCDAGVNLVVAK